MLTFDVPLKKGDTEICGLLHDDGGEILSGAYYVYVRL